MTRSWVDDSKLPFGDSRAIRMADVAQCAQYIQKYAQISTDEALDRTNQFCHRSCAVPGRWACPRFVVEFKIGNDELKRLCSGSALGAFWPASSRQVARGLSHEELIMTVLMNTPASLFATSLVATQSLAIAAAPLMIGVGVFAGGLMGGLMVVQDFKLRKKAEVALEEDGTTTAAPAATAPTAIVRQSVRQPFKRLVRG